MYSSNYYLETSILSSVLFAHNQCRDEQFFYDVELKEEYFTNQFHKIVVRQINENKVKNIPIQDDYVCQELAKKRIIDDNLYTNIMMANPFSKYLFEKYYANMKKGDKSIVAGL